MKLTRTDNLEMNSRWIFWLLAFAAFFFALGVHAGESIDNDLREYNVRPSRNECASTRPR